MSFNQDTGMKKIAKAILYNNKKILLQLRDNKDTIAYPNTWTLLGGRIEKNETAKEALKREIKEELNIDIKNPKVLFTKKRTQDGEEVEDNIFYLKVSLEVIKNRLNEGQKIKFFTSEELDKENIFLPFKKYIFEFLNTKR